MSVKRQRASPNSIVGMTDPTGVQDAQAAAQIRELQENIRRLQARLDALTVPEPLPQASERPAQRLPRFIAGPGIDLIARKDFVQIGAVADPYGPVYQVSAVDRVNVCVTVKRIWKDGTLSASSEVTGVLYQAAFPVNVGEQGQVVRLADGKLAFVKEYAWLWEVTVVGAGVVDVGIADGVGGILADSTIEDVPCSGGAEVGDTGQVLRLGDGSLFWQPIFDLRALAGYNDAATQFLIHVSGTLTWVTATSC